MRQRERWPRRRPRHGDATPCCGECLSAPGPPDRADRGDRAQVLDQHLVDGESALAETVGQLVPEVPGSLRRGVARVPEEVDGSIPGEVLADGTERRLRLLPEGSDVEGEDLVEAPIAELRVLQRDGLEHSPARVDVLAVPPCGHLDHLGRAVDRGDRSRRQPLADQGDRDAVAAADLEQAVGRADLQGVDRPDEPLRCLARHARAIASRAREAHADLLDERLGGRLRRRPRGRVRVDSPQRGAVSFPPRAGTRARRLSVRPQAYETMLLWETDPSLRDNELGAAFADVWCAIPKVVLSRTLDSVPGNARLAEASVAEEAAATLELGLVDELRMFRNPVVLGGGTPFLPPVTEDVPLDLIETRTVASRVIYERYGRARD